MFWLVLPLFAMVVLGIVFGKREWKMMLEEGEEAGRLKIIKVIDGGKQ